MASKSKTASKPNPEALPLESLDEEMCAAVDLATKDIAVLQPCNSAEN